MTNVKCQGCGKILEYSGEPVFRCPQCGQDNSNVATLLDNNLVERLGLAAGYRRIGNFEYSQRELDSVLTEKPDCVEAVFASALNDYEVTEYSFDGTSIKTCTCSSTSTRPVDKSADLNFAVANSHGRIQEQYRALCAEIEYARRENNAIRKNIPSYRAIVLYDYSSETDATAARGIFERLKNKTDIFFPPVTLSKLAVPMREKYLIQTLKTPNIAPLMFVIYTNAYNFRNKSGGYYTNIARQCEDFARVHEKSELISVTTDYEPPFMLRRLSKSTIECGSFHERSLNAIADKIYDYILELAYDYEEEKQARKNNARILLNDKPSPIIKP